MTTMRINLSGSMRDLQTIKDLALMLEMSRDVRRGLA
jgi:hypothetical protein